MPIGVGTAIAGSAAIGGITSLIGGKQAANAANKAANINLAMYHETAGRLQPWVDTGRANLPGLNTFANLPPTGNQYYPDYIKAASDQPVGTETQAQLEATPGYQFIKSQGLAGVQSANAARGLGVSGAAMKGAADYATGLANQTYQNIFNQQQTKFQNQLNLNTASQGNITNAFNRLYQTATLGENAAASAGTAGTAAGQAAGNMFNQAGLSEAAGTQGVGSAVTSAVNNALQYNMYNDYMNRRYPAK